MSEAIKAALEQVEGAMSLCEDEDQHEFEIIKQFVLAALSAEQPEPVAAKPLQWEEVGKHLIYGTDGCAFAHFGNLDHSVGHAGFNVYQNYDGWQATFWHGNRGHSVGVHATKDEAKAAAQARANEIVASVTAPIAAPASQPVAYQYGDALIWPDVISDEHKAKALPLIYPPQQECYLSWDGKQVHGDKASIDAVRTALHQAGTVPELRARLSTSQPDAAAIRNKALEEAIRACEGQLVPAAEDEPNSIDHAFNGATMDCIRAIRALAQAPQEQLCQDEGCDFFKRAICQPKPEGGGCIATLASQEQQEQAAIDFSKPLETMDGEPVEYVNDIIIEYKCARVCVDPATGIVFSSPYHGLRIRNAAPVTQQAGQPELTVWYGPMPESNGRLNFTAILMRKGGDFVDGHTIDRSEYPDRVRYEADRVRYLIGELNERPFILDYDADKHSGYAAPAQEGEKK